MSESMRYDFTADQQMYQDAMRAFLRDRYGWDERTKAIADSAGFRTDIWRGLGAELGVLGVGFAESDGGIGCGGVDLLAIMGPMGEALVTEPYGESVIFAGAILRASGTAQAKTVIGDLIAGRAVPLVAANEPSQAFEDRLPQTLATNCDDGFRLSGRKAIVPGAPKASHFLVTARMAGTDDVGIFLVPADAPQLARRDVATIDGRCAADLDFAGVEVPLEALLIEPPEAGAVLDRAVDHMTVALCGEAIGILDSLVAQTVSHTSQRQQFGRPLADFQVLQHRMADMKIMLEQARAVTFLAASHLGAAPPRRRAAVSAAKAQINKACRFVGQSAVQLHGGMGMTMELPIGHYFRRATVIERSFGSTEDHLLRFAATADHGLI